MLTAGNANAILCHTDEECTEKAAKEIANPALNFVWTQLRDLNAFQEAAAARQGQVPYRLARGACAAVQPNPGQELYPPFPWQGWQSADAYHAAASNSTNAEQQPGSHVQPAAASACQPNGLAGSNHKPVQPACSDAPPSSPSADKDRRSKCLGHRTEQTSGMASKQHAPAAVLLPLGQVEQPHSDADLPASGNPAADCQDDLDRAELVEAQPTDAEGQQRAVRHIAGIPATEQTESQVLSLIDQHVGRMFSAASSTTLFIVPTCQGSTGFVRLMQVRCHPPHRITDSDDERHGKLGMAMTVIYDSCADAMQPPFSTAAIWASTFKVQLS